MFGLIGKIGIFVLRRNRRAKTFCATGGKPESPSDAAHVAFLISQLSLANRSSLCMSIGIQRYTAISKAR